MSNPDANANVRRCIKIINEKKKQIEYLNMIVSEWKTMAYTLENLLINLQTEQERLRSENTVLRTENQTLQMQQQRILNSRARRH